MKTYKHTKLACYIAYITQGIIVNFAPLLFLTFRDTFDLTMEQLTVLITFNFAVQLSVDLLSANFADKIGYRPCMVAAHVFCMTGLVGLAVFPFFMPPYAGIALATLLYAVGGGLLEVLISPIVAACPSEGKSADMSILHSFYCWGVVAVILLSTVMFRLFGMENWRIVSCLWAIIPAVNAVIFTQVPIAPIVAEGEGMTVGRLLKTKLFWILALLMICSGAAEVAMAQWASAFAEDALNVSKTVGDLAGPCMFALCMGIGRVFYAKFADKIHLENYIVACAVLCVISYVMTVAPIGAAFNLLGCGICGLSVAMTWPGMLSLAAVRCPSGGTAMFGLMAVGGDIGCTTGPTLVGLISGAAGDDLKAGLLAAVIFPFLIILGIKLLRNYK